MIATSLIPRTSRILAARSFGHVAVVRRTSEGLRMSGFAAAGFAGLAFPVF